MSILTTYSPAEIAVWYVAGALAWAFVLGLFGDADSFAPTLGKIAIWPISLAITIGGCIRGILGLIFE